MCHTVIIHLKFFSTAGTSCKGKSMPWPLLWLPGNVQMRKWAHWNLLWCWDVPVSLPVQAGPCSLPNSCCPSTFDGWVVGFLICHFSLSIYIWIHFPVSHNIHPHTSAPPQQTALRHYIGCSKHTTPPSSSQMKCNITIYVKSFLKSSVWAKSDYHSTPLVVPVSGCKIKEREH